MVAVARLLLANLATVLMVAVGLRTSPQGLRAAWRERFLVGRALFVLFVCVPLLAVCVVSVLPLSPLAAEILLVMAVCPGAPFVLRAYRDRAAGVEIIAIASLLAPLGVVVWLAIWNELFGYELAVNLASLARVGIDQLLALGAGIATAAVWPRVAARLSRVAWWTFLVGFALVLVAVVAMGVRALFEVRPAAIVAVLAIGVGSAVLGHLAGGPRPADRGLVATTAVLGNPALAIAVIAATFPGFRPGALLAAYVCVRAVALFAYTQWAKHHHPPPRRDAPTLPFSITRGGAFYRALDRLGLVDDTGTVRYGWLVALAWLPLLAATLVVEPPAIVRDPAMHVRIAIAVPLLVVAERALDLRCRGATRQLRDEHVIDGARLDAILASAERLRDLWSVEIALGIAALAIGQIGLWGTSGWAGFVHGELGEPTRSLPVVWCLTVVLPLFHFLALRWLWRWAIWSYIVIRVARCRLSLDALHPDRAAGLGLFAGPLDAFVLFLAALASIASAAWIVEVHAGLATLPSLALPFFTLFAIAIAVAVGPLLAFAGSLYSARRRDAAACHAFARAYADDFRRRLADRSDTSDAFAARIQALGSLGTIFRTAHTTRLVPFGPRAIVFLWAGAVVPMLPLVVSATPIWHVVLELGRLLLGFGR